MCDDRAVSRNRTPSTGTAVIAVAALVLTAVGAFLLMGLPGGDSSESAESRDLAAVLPAMCQMQEAVDAGTASRAFNIFWDSVHTDAHIMAARIDAADRAQGERFRQAKGFIERDLGTLSIVGLKQHVPTMIVEVRNGLRTLGLPGADTPCP